MTFDYSQTGKLTITMYDYINGVIQNAGEVYKTGPGSATLAPEYLSKIRETNDDNNQLLEKVEK